jgi:glycosyltransferase involved in cell wall biosynthesis
MAPRNLRLLVVAYHFPPVNSSGAQRPVQMLRYLPRFGVDVSVLTRGYERTGLASEVNVVRIYDTNSRGRHKALHYPLRVLQRTARTLGAATSWHGVWAWGVKRNAAALLRHTRPDVILSSYPPIETLEIGLFLSRQAGVSLVADFRDGLLFEPIEQEMLRSTRTRARYRDVEERIARDAAGILTVSDPISDYFRTKYGHRAVMTLPNGFDPEERWIDPTPGELDPHKFNIVYTGRLEMSEKGRRASSFLAAVEQLVADSPLIGERLRVHLLGEFSGAELASLSPLVERGIVRVHGFVDRERSLGFQRAANLLLLVASSGKASVVTGKLFEYLASGRPILGVTRGTAAERIILETGAGYVVDPADSTAIRVTLERAVADPDFLGSLRRRDEEIEKYSRPRQMEVLASFLREVVDASTNTP